MTQLLFIDLKEYLDLEKLRDKIELESGKDIKTVPHLSFVEVLHNGEAKLEVTFNEEKN